VKKSHLRISFGDIHDRSHGGDGSHDTHPIKTLLRKGKKEFNEFSGREKETTDRNVLQGRFPGKVFFIDRVASTEGNVKRREREGEVTHRSLKAA
jgi:hypothetical protein